MLGRFKHTLDTKNRVIVPAKMRTQLGETFVAAAVLDHCISLYSAEEWEKLQGKLAEMPFSKTRTLQRYLSSNAVELETDNQGRVILPKNLLEYANIEKEALFVGAGPRAEIWNPASFDDNMANMTSEEVEAEFIELGF